MKKLILDESKWRCGGDSPNPKNRRGKIGTETQLLNEQGRMCCLGQFSLQLNKKLKKKDILELAEPVELRTDIPPLNERSDYGYIRNTSLSKAAMLINDTEETSVEEKVKKLKELFVENGFKIVFKRQKRK